MRKIATVYVEIVRNVPLLVFIILIYLAVVLDMFPNTQRRAGASDRSPSSACAARRSSCYEGATWKFLVVVAALVLARGWSCAGGGRPPTGAAWPARAGWWALGIGAVVLVVLWLALGLGGSTPDGRTGVGSPAASR